MQRLTGGEILAEYLIAEGVPYVIGIPGHGDVALFDPLVDRQDKIKALLSIHEQGAAHMADAYYRVTGKPLAVYTSIGPGACNTLVGVAQAYVDSTAMLLVTGSAHTYMRGRAVLQEFERQQWADFASVMRPVVKQSIQVSRVEQVPFAVHRAFNQMLSDRPGPVHIDFPMDVQADQADVDMSLYRNRVHRNRSHGDAQMIDRAADLLVNAKRPVLLYGGGVITSEASIEARTLGEWIGAAMTTTWMGKGAIPEDHDLYAWHPGSPGSTVANELCLTADVIVAVGCRFTDWSSSSYHSEGTFSIPNTKLIQIDIDSREIGKNYPAEIGIIGDAKSVLSDLLQAVQERLKQPRDYRESDYYREIVERRAAWFELLRPAQTYGGSPTTISRALVEIRKGLERDAIVVTGAGLPQNQTYQEFPVYEPRTNITSGGFSTMGFTVPGAIGAKLGAPDRQVVGIAGDGDFLQTCEELAVAVQYGLPVTYVVLNNQGWSSIRNLQEGVYGAGRSIVTEFKRRDGTPYTPDFVQMAHAFGAKGVRIDDPAQLAAAVRKAANSDDVWVIEVTVNKQGLYKAGWWDVPVPAYLTEAREEYERERGKVVF